MYQFIKRSSCDYHSKISIKINMATDQENSGKEIWHWKKKDEIKAAVQNWLYVWVELMDW